MWRNPRLPLGGWTNETAPERCFALAPLRLFIQPSSVVIDRVDLALGAVPEEHILRQSLQRELTRWHQQALEHRLDRVELLGATPHAFLDLLWREILRHEHAAEVVRVHVGIGDDDAALGLELFAHRGALARRHRVEESFGCLDLVQEAQRLVEDLGTILLEAEEEVERIVNAVMFEALEQLLVLLGVVLNLVHREQAFLAYRLDADIDMENACLGCKLEQIFVVVRVDRPQTRETDIKRYQRLEQLAGELVLAGYLVVDELEAAKAGYLDSLLDLVDDVLDRAGAIAAVVEDWNLTERASVGTSAAGLDRYGLEQVAVEPQQFMAGTGQVLQVVQLVGAIGLLELAVLPVAQKRFPYEVSFTLHDAIRMLECFLGLQSGMKAAHHDRDSAPAKFIAELVRPQRRANSGGHPDQVPSAVEVDVLQPFVT